MDTDLSATIHLSYFPFPTIDTAHMLFLYFVWTLLIVSWIIVCIRAPYYKFEERYSLIERTLITKRATSPPGEQNKNHTEEPKKDCSICQTSFQEDDLVSWSPSPQCCHVYHHMCLKRWLLEHSECPSCRQSFDFHEAVTSGVSDDSYFCVRDGLQHASLKNVDDKRSRCISPEELKQYRDYSIYPDDPWDSDELLQSYRRHIRLPPV